MRILVTGSRDWDDFEAIVDAVVYELGPDPHESTLVSGACPTGADALCEQVARDLGATVELHPAEWDIHGKRAGFVRNRQMVELGADVCLAFIKNDSLGASMTARLAEEAGIPVKRFEVTE